MRVQDMNAQPVVTGSVNSERFWMVWNPDGGSPTARHYVREDADREATRLALKCPGQTFYVLKAVGGRQTAEAPLREILMVARLRDEDIPF